MSATLGSGDYVYEELSDWEKLPEGWIFKEVVDVAVDSQDRVYVFNRGEHPMMVFERDGTFLTSWGEWQFTRPHGVSVGPDETLYCADDDGHWIGKFDLEGRLLMSIGRLSTLSSSPNSSTGQAVTPIATDRARLPGSEFSRSKNKLAPRRIPTTTIALTHTTQPRVDSFTASQLSVRIRRGEIIARSRTASVSTRSVARSAVSGPYRTAATSQPNSSVASAAQATTNSQW